MEAALSSKTLEPIHRSTRRVFQKIGIFISMCARASHQANLLSLDLISKSQTLAIVYGTPGTTINIFRVPAERNRQQNQLPLAAPAALI